MLESVNRTNLKSFQSELNRLKQEHSNLDLAIDTLVKEITNNSMEIQRLKKRKLFLKDQIAFLEDGSTPDIIA